MTQLATDRPLEARSDSRMIRTFDDAELATLRKRFSGAHPFPHVVIDDLLTPRGLEAVRHFPAADWTGWSSFGDAYQRGKLVCNDIEAIPGPLAALIHEMSAPRFLSAIERVTGLDKLIPDPHLNGGGLHSTGEGGILVPHTDFHVYAGLNLFRYINVLLYLSPDFGPEDGGALELFRKGSDKAETAITPALGRCVIFKTDDNSVHGFTNPVRKKRRNSIALYYYRSEESATFGGDTTTHWQQHGARTGVRGARLRIYQGLLFISRAFSKLAHLANPNMRPDHSGKRD